MADGKTQSEKVEGVARDLQRDEADARWQGLCARWVRNLRRRSRMRGKPQRAITVMLFLLIAACGAEDQIDGYASLERHVANSRVGADVDHWIEMKNMAGEWERTGLIFGYLGDYDECLKAIAGLKTANYAREYRCVPAN